MKFIFFLLVVTLAACNSTNSTDVNFCDFAKSRVRTGVLAFENTKVEKCTVVSVEENKEANEEIKQLEPDSKAKMYFVNLELVVDGQPVNRILNAEVLDKKVHVISNEEKK